MLRRRPARPTCWRQALAAGAVELDGIFPSVVLSPADATAVPPIYSAQLSGALNLRDAAAQFFGPATLVPLATSFLIGAAAFAVRRLYVRASSRESRRRSLRQQSAPAMRGGAPPLPGADIGSLEIRTEKPDGPVETTFETTVAFRHAAAAFRRAALVYVLGGLVFIAASVTLIFAFGVEPLPSGQSRLTVLGCCAGVVWSWCLIAFIALAMFWGPDRRVRGILVAVYVIALPAMGVFLQLAGAEPLRLVDVGLMPKEEAALLVSFASATTGRIVSPESVMLSPLVQPVVFWGLTASPMLIVAISFNRLIRGTVGPLFVNVALIMTLCTIGIVDVALSTSSGLWFIRHLKGAFGDATYHVLLLLGAAMSACIAWFGMRRAADRYRRKRMSDQAFLFDSLWLSVSLYLCIVLMNGPHVYLVGLLPFVLYKAVVGLGLKPLAARASSLPNARLLFLRVFGSASRSERLFDLLSARWRYAGSIQLLSAPDVARARFEPDEFLDFLAGKLASRFVETESDLDRRLADLDLRTDPDGRYRVNELFCRDDTWKQTVRRLLAQSDLVAMDLRAFTAQRTGAAFELGAMIDDVPLEQVVLLIDRTTDEPFLRRTLVDLWRNVSPASPNARAGLARVRILDLAGGYLATVRRLMRLGDRIVASGRSAGVS